VIVRLAGLILIGAVASTAAASPDAYRSCPGSDALAKATRLSWDQGKGVLDEHRAFRAKMGVPLPPGSPRVLWFATGGELATTTFSVTAGRRPDGLWHVDGVGRSQVWIQGAPPTDMPRMDRMLSADDSRALDHAIADRCLRDGPRCQDNPNIVAGGLYETLEIETPDGRWVGAWHGAATPQETAVTGLIGDK
jgi:hypothetical protein